MSEKMFPLQTSRHAPPGPLSIPWSVAEKAYGAYAAKYGRSQSIERLAERGGFGWCEMDTFYPKWREEVDEITKLREAIKDAGFAVMQTSGKWSIHDVGERGKAEEAKSLEVATRNAELESGLETIWELADDELRRLGAVPGSNMAQIEANAVALLAPARARGRGDE